MIDVNVHLSRWPFRRVPHDETSELVATLKSRGVSRAWVGSFDAILHRDVAAVNARLADECRRYGAGFLVPFGVVNPKLPDWEEDLRRCVDEHRMPGIRVYPNYHGYGIDDPDFARLAELAVRRRLVLQIAASLEDERTQHPLVRVPPLDLRPLVPLVERHKDLAVVILNVFHGMHAASAELARIVAAGRVYVELATLEGVGGIETLLKSVRLDRVLFGSHFPFFNLESARLKLDESALAQPQRRRITEENALHLVP
jgi:uncharacterized protein